MKKILLTGGAGFIGSNLSAELLKQGFFVRVLDNFSTGFRSNLEALTQEPNFELVEGDITDLNTCLQACQGIDAICHQAALGSVPRSIKQPFDTVKHNIDGFVNVAFAAHQSGIKRLVYASSSSVYGDNRDLPKREAVTGKPLSPYAISKWTNEVFAQNFAELYGLECIGFRYFNVFGPKQSPQGPYAAVIPKFIQACLEGREAEIHGQGLQSRDFTHISNVVKANILALTTNNPQALNQVYNIGCGGRYSVLHLWQTLTRLNGRPELEAHFTAPRHGDIQDSQADIDKARNLLGYEVQTNFEQGLAHTLAYWQNKML